MKQIQLKVDALIEHTVQYEDMVLKDSIDFLKNVFYDLADEDEVQLPWSEVSEMISFCDRATITVGTSDEYGDEGNNLIPSKFNYRKILRGFVWVLFLPLMFFFEAKELVYPSLTLAVISFTTNHFYRKSKITKLDGSALAEVGTWSFFVTGKSSSHLFYDSKYDKHSDLEQEALSLLNLAEALDEDPIGVDTYTYISDIYSIELKIENDFKVIYVSDDLPNSVSIGKMNWFQREIFNSSFTQQISAFFIGVGLVALFY